jgi:hypothetical protein
MQSICWFGTLALLSSAAVAGERAVYEVTLDATWSAATHPLEHPASAHFSWSIAASHDEGYRLFEEGAIASSGLERLAEEGELDPFDAEIQAAVDRGAAGALFAGKPIQRAPGRTAFDIEVTTDHPMVSFATMVAPSPDWFIGAAGVPLLVDDRWVAEKTLPLVVWDAGTDGGLTFLAADADTRPRERVAPSASKHFNADGRAVPIGRVTFRRK